MDGVRAPLIDGTPGPSLVAANQAAAIHPPSSARLDKIKGAGASSHACGHRPTPAPKTGPRTITRTTGFSHDLPKGVRLDCAGSYCRPCAEARQPAKRWASCSRQSQTARAVTASYRQEQPFAGYRDPRVGPQNHRTLSRSWPGLGNGQVCQVPSHSLLVRESPPPRGLSNPERTLIQPQRGCEKIEIVRAPIRCHPHHMCPPGSAWLLPTM